MADTNRMTTIQNARVYRSASDEGHNREVIQGAKDGEAAEHGDCEHGNRQQDRHGSGQFSNPSGHNGRKDSTVIQDSDRNSIEGWV
jgi:hypothetical protein